MKTALDNVDALLKEFEKQLQEKFATINPLKFSDPEVQSSLNDAVMEAAKRGYKSNIQLLVNLIFQKVQQKENDLQSITAGEAIKIVSKLSIQQLDLLTFLYLFHFLIPPNLASSAEEIISVDDYFKLSFLLQSISSIKLLDFQHLESQRCIINNSDFNYKFYRFASFFRDTEQINIKSYLPPNQVEIGLLKKNFKSTYYDNNLNSIELTIIGRLIGWINISKYINCISTFEEY
jgi:hypothetical protein